MVDISPNREWILVETDTLSPYNDFPNMSDAVFREVFSVLSGHYFATLKRLEEEEENAWHWKYSR